jgi:uncharacterized protein YhaN
MGNAGEPQTDRELLIQLKEQVSRLSDAIEKFAEKLESFEEKKLAGLEERITKIENWMNKWLGVWQFVLLASVILSIISFISKFR